MADEKNQGGDGRDGGQGKKGDDCGCSCGGGPQIRPRPPGTCICPKCQTTAPHVRGTPCFKINCPKCGTPMIHMA